jgi:hypothetical protein
MSRFPNQCGQMSLVREMIQRLINERLDNRSYNDQLRFLTRFGASCCPLNPPPQASLASHHLRLTLISKWLKNCEMRAD